MPNTGPYCVYVLECRDGSYYCGITTDMQKRLRQHNAGTASRYTRARTPVKIIACTPHCYSRSAASKLEHRIKKAPRHKKPALLTMHARQAEKD